MRLRPRMALLAAVAALAAAASPAQPAEEPRASTAADGVAADGAAADGTAAGRAAMDALIEEIRQDAARTASYTGIGDIDAAVLDALRSTPREHFVPPRNRPLAYRNHPLPIGHGQTISQPFIVALMTHALRLRPHHRVLEIGTGSGYQAAVLAALAGEVYSVEIVPELAASATSILRSLGYRNVHVRAGDGRRGWPEQAPFDAIIVTAVGSEIPPELIEQLSGDGLLVMPVGDPEGFQELILYSKRDDRATRLLPVRFVPLTGVEREPSVSSD